MSWWLGPGYRRGWRWCFSAGMPSWIEWRYHAPYVISKEDELKWLEEEKKLLEEELKWIERRIDELKSEKK